MANLAISSHQCIPQNLSRMAVALPKRLNEFTGRAPTLAEQLVDLAAYRHAASIDTTPSKTVGVVARPRHIEG